MAPIPAKKKTWRKRDPRLPKGPANSYALFIKFYTQKRNAMLPGQKISFPELQKQCSKAWKGLAPEHRQFFKNEAVKDLERYRSEMDRYSSRATEMEQPKRRRRRPKNPNLPLKPLSAFMWYSAEFRWKVQQRFPHYTLAEISKELSKMWAGLDAESKTVYNVLQERDRERYFREKRLSCERSGGASLEILGDINPAV